MLIDRVIGYVALFKIVEGKYIVEFPDLQGCFSQGDTLEEAICKAQEALAIYYENKNGRLPSPSSLSSIQQANPNVIAQVVVFSIAKPLRAVKKTLTIPEWLNTLSEKYQVNFSQILKNALIDYLKSLNSLSPRDRIILDDKN